MAVSDRQVEPAMDCGRIGKPLTDVLVRDYCYRCGEAFARVVPGSDAYCAPCQNMNRFDLMRTIRLVGTPLQVGDMFGDAEVVAVKSDVRCTIRYPGGRTQELSRYTTLE